MDREERAQKLLEAGLHLAAELSLPVVLQRIVELAADVTGARYGALGVIGPDGIIIEFVTHGLSTEQRAHIGALPIGRGILGAVITDARPLRLRDISEDPRSVGFPPNHPPMHSFLGAPVMARGRVFGNIYLTEKKEAVEFDDEDEQALVILAAQAGVAIENARLYEEARNRERRLEATREITNAILSGQDSEPILEVVAARARELARASLATIVLRTEDPESLIVDVADGEGGQGIRGVSFGIQGSISGDVITSGRPVIVADASSDQRADQPVVQGGNIGPAMFVPLVSQGRPFGTLALANGVGGRVFNDDDLAMVQAFAAQASVAIEYARAQRELQRLAVMDDRERIAKELHDGAIQALFAVGMGLQGTATLSRDAAIESRIESAVGEIDRVIRDLRNYIFGLRPGILADRQLDQALHQLARELQERAGVTTVVDVDREVAAELASRAADIIQFVRESLSNVERHAQAATCRVSLYRKDRSAVLEIDDDGRGFDPESAFGMGHGLPNLKERAAALGANLQMASRPGSGTTVTMTLPL